MFTGDFNDFNKIVENSAIETYFQVLTGDFNDLKNVHNSRIEKYFQVLSGGFNDFKELLTI